MRRRVGFEMIRAVLLASISLLFTNMALSAEEGKSAPAAEPELVIVKYGSISIKSSVPEARVYVDDLIKGTTDRVIENIVVGDHVISCKTDNKTVSGTFQIRKNETLRLEARFDEGKLVPSKEPVKLEPEKKKAEPPEKPKKTAPEPKKVDRNPVEERRKAHLNVMRIDYEVTDTPAIKVQQFSNHDVISKNSLKKNAAGKYYRTKQGVLLCDAGPCELSWSASFIYEDETGSTDALLVNWKETVFNGITPKGTSKHDLECCLNGQCSKLEEDSKIESKEFEMGRYRIMWTGKLVLIRRSDILKEIIEAGKSVADY